MLIHLGKLLKNKDQRDTLKSSSGEKIHIAFKGAIEGLTDAFLIDKEVTLWSAEKNKLTNYTTTLSENIFQKWKQEKDIKKINQRNLFPIGLQ